MEYIKLSVTTNSAGAGTHTCDFPIYGEVRSMGFTYATTADAGTVATVDIYTPNGPALTVAAANGTNTEGWADLEYEPMVLNGYPRLQVTAGGSGIANCCIAHIYVREVGA